VVEKGEGVFGDRSVPPAEGEVKGGEAGVGLGVVADEGFGPRGHTEAQVGEGAVEPAREALVNGEVGVGDD